MPARPLPFGFALTATLCLAFTSTWAASPEWESPPVSHKDVKPYTDGSSRPEAWLPPAPAPDSPADRDDVNAVLARQKGDAARRESAELDAKWLYDRFAPVLGVDIRRDKLPALVHLLNRSVRESTTPTFAAKKTHARLRPHQRLALDHVCGLSGASQPDPDATQRTSYPSGHATFGWVTALVLARVVPERAPALLQRGAEYADSRVVCGLHFPSDVEAARQLATAVVTRLDLHPEFQQDLQRARAEWAAPR
ncbi:phosphatase PAP2 family protein [Inhella gelatinilytica]|uniref:Acid phosphatase n=1 Tax=Inhella gelatinilytica TaxID=2795030 RepID=A0A931IU91_9BURK|nr:phosphatase PAP2 family protein [Inhella gelatinilytica]MBH9551636.1 phosphatase PAP2 family protein [Inhella gelatinilytica]